MSGYDPDEFYKVLEENKQLRAELAAERAAHALEKAERDAAAAVSHIARCLHRSDCDLHNAPAMMPRECSCGANPGEQPTAASIAEHIGSEHKDGPCTECGVAK